jgi:hypothetical protein
MVKSDEFDARITEAERLLKSIRQAAYSLICESNGLSDNEWKTPNGTYTPNFPIRSYGKALDRLSKQVELIDAYFDPSDIELTEEWKLACTTGTEIVRGVQAKNPNVDLRFLSREIADAIFDSYRRKRKIKPERVKGLFASLTPEQQGAALAYDGPENFGDPEFLNKKVDEKVEENITGCPHCGYWHPPDGMCL